MSFSFSLVTSKHAQFLTDSREAKNSRVKWISKYYSNAYFTEAAFLHISYICSIFFILVSQQYFFTFLIYFFFQSSKSLPNPTSHDVPSCRSRTCLWGEINFLTEKKFRRTLFLRS